MLKLHCPPRSLLPCLITQVIWKNQIGQDPLDGITLNVVLFPCAACSDCWSPGSGRVPVHCGCFQLLPQILQQERRRRRTRYEMWWYDDGICSFISTLFLLFTNGSDIACMAKVLSTWESQDFKHVTGKDWLFMTLAAVQLGGILWQWWCSHMPNTFFPRDVRGFLVSCCTAFWQWFALHPCSVDGGMDSVRNKMGVYHGYVKPRVLLECTPGIPCR